MLMKFFDNKGNEYHVEGDDELDCMQRFISGNLQMTFEKYDDEGNLLDDNNFPIMD